MSLSETQFKFHLYYGWYVLAATFTFVILFFNSDARYSFGVRSKGFAFDRTGSYRLALILSATMALIALFCTMLIKEKKHLRPKEI